MKMHTCITCHEGVGNETCITYYMRELVKRSRGQHGHQEMVIHSSTVQAALMTWMFMHKGSVLIGFKLLGLSKVLAYFSTGKTTWRLY